jgi:hypothetical protein
LGEILHFPRPDSNDKWGRRNDEMIESCSGKKIKTLKLI